MQFIRRNGETAGRTSIIEHRSTPVPLIPRAGHETL